MSLKSTLADTLYCAIYLMYRHFYHQVVHSSYSVEHGNKIGYRFYGALS